MPGDWAIYGRAIHAPDGIEALVSALICVGTDGMILSVETAVAADDPRLARLRAGGSLVELTPDDILIPGLIDLHIHAPQFPQLGTALDVPLEDWLQRYTFPLESRYEDLAFAEDVYACLVETLLAHGTTTAVYFATIHLPATKRLAEICLDKGQRALVGRVGMDHPEQCPDFYRDASAEIAIAETRALIGHIRDLPGNEAALVRPMITPRFVPACTDALLEGLGALAAETRCTVQTHCSESDWEHGHVLDRCGVTDTAVLDRAGLLRRGSVLAHANFITEPDAALIRARGAAVAHCPLSNIYFAGAVFPLREMLDQGLHIGLGSDIAGGPSASLFEAARQAVAVSRLLESGTDSRKSAAARGKPGARIDFRTAFRMATAGGGESLDLPIGLFRPGYAFDAVLLRSGLPDGNLRFAEAESAAGILEKIVMLAGRGDVAQVWVAGRLVKSR
ncbi:guanine deaminase [Acidisoma cellulosilytica]|uniref:Guanine deaminase n=2 Tax=Acidisoma cellulosilyticum TaxID=2802395 RepID=A0A963Z168_9PROT|nr:guanine deaminase [Acidisoma cellulosilyticum]